jgi:hypothetical protein
MVYSDFKAGISGAVHFGNDNRYQKSVFILTNFKNGPSFENDNFSSEKSALISCPPTQRQLYILTQTKHTAKFSICDDLLL